MQYSDLIAIALASMVLVALRWGVAYNVVMIICDRLDHEYKMQLDFQNCETGERP